MENQLDNYLKLKKSDSEIDNLLKKNDNNLENSLNIIYFEMIDIINKNSNILHQEIKNLNYKIEQLRLKYIEKIPPLKNISFVSFDFLIKGSEIIGDIMSKNNTERGIFWLVEYIFPDTKKDFIKAINKALKNFFFNLLTKKREFNIYFDNYYYNLKDKYENEFSLQISF